MARIEQFGLDVGTYGKLAQPEIILGLARYAEEVGFDSAWLPDHVAFPTKFESKYPYSATGSFPAPLSDPLLEPIATMGVLIGATKRLKIGTAVLIVPYRNPVLLGRMLVTLDQFSGGRVILGAGVGWLAEEFTLLGTAEFKRRGKATDEYLEIFKAICAGGEAAFEGETYRFDPIYSVPGSVQRPHPPILIGGLADAALKRVVRHGTGWLAVTIGPNQLPERLSRLRQLCAEHGRRYEDLSLVYKIFLDPGEPKRGKFDAREPGSGSVQQIVDDLKAVFDLGFERIVMRYRGTDAATQRREIARFVDDIVPRV
jgi:probable F420-dependent oxidoreductase